MNEQALRFRLGLFVLASLILLAVLILLFGGFPNYFKDSNAFTLIFDNAQGITPGTPVSRSGVKIGEVRSIALDNETGKVQIGIQVDSKYTIRKSDRPTLVSGLLGGDTEIAFLPTKDREIVKDVTPVEPGSTLVGVASFEASTLLQKAGEVITPTQEAMVEMKRFFQTMEKLQPVLEESLKEFREVARSTRELIPEAKEIFKATRETIPEFREMAKAARETIPEFREVAKAARETIPEFKEVAKATREAIPEFREVAKRMNETLPEFRDFAKAGKEAIPEFREVAKATREAIPDIRKTNDELRELIKTTNKAVPDMQKKLERTNEEFQLTARTWGKLGERLDLMVATNEDKITKSIEQLQKTLEGVAQVFNEENQKNLAEMLRNVRKGSENIEGIAKNTEELIKDSRVTMKRVNESLANIDGIVTNMNKLTKPLAERGDSVLKNLDEVTLKLNQILGDVREVFGTVVRTDGTVQKLFADPALYNNLNETLISAQKLVPRVDRILRDVEIFADRIARHPEALGVGGALRPSTGLKEVPPIKGIPSYP